MSISRPRPSRATTTSVLTGGLRLAAADNRLGHLDAERLDRITATVGELVDDLDGHEDVKAIEAPSSNETSPIATLAATESDDETTMISRSLAGFTVYPLHPGI